MSLDIDWKLLDASLGLTIKDLLNRQLDGAVELPGFIHSIEILNFDLGTVPPEITIKDIVDPFIEFYEEDDDETQTTQDDEENEEDPINSSALAGQSSLLSSPEQRRRSVSGRRASTYAAASTMDDFETASVVSGPPPYAEHLGHRPIPSSSGWEGVHVPYFHSAFATPNAGIVSASGLSTPQPRFMSWSNTFQPVPSGADKSEQGSTRSRRLSSNGSTSDHGRAETVQNGSAEDTQLEIEVSYTGNIVIALQVNLALNFPSSAFVTLPVEMTISEVRIDTVAVVAYIKQRIHVSLLEGMENPIKDMKISSVIGEQDKMSLTDVERVERFMLKEIQSVIERELVFPSYYTLIL